MIHDRGQTPVYRQSSVVTMKGMLFDAGCRDRTSLNLTSPPETLAQAMPVETTPETQAASKGNPNAVTAHGISVDSKTMDAERADALRYHNPDMVTRQADRSCAITGGTTGYAVRLDDGRVLDLDEGGNTLASESVLASKSGRAMLNGTAFGFKPRVTIVGHVRGDRLMVQQIVPE